MTDRELMRQALEASVYWFARTDEEGAGPTYVVGRSDEEITHPCLFRWEAQAIVDALDRMAENARELGLDYEQPNTIARAIEAKLREKNA